MTLAGLTVGDFLDRLASADATPGGGSASALTVATGAALVAMVARLSEAGAGEAARDPGDRAERLRGSLTALIETDAAAFDGVMVAYRMPRSTDAEKARRREAVQRALREAAEVPLEVARQAGEVLRAAVDLAPVANRNAISDLGVAAALAEAGAHGASLNVAINVRGLTDRELAGRLSEDAQRAMEVVTRLRAEALSIVTERLAAA